MHDCDNCGGEYVFSRSDAEFPSAYCSAACQRAADAESMGVSI